MRALAYLEWRRAVHHANAIVRSPGRLLLWLGYLLAVGATSLSRFFPAQYSIFGHGPDAPHATAAAGIYLATLGSTMVTAAAGRVAPFRSLIEPVLWSNARLRPVKIALWLQLRTFAASLRTYLSSFAYLSILFVPHHANVIVTIRAFVAVILAGTLLFGLQLPAFFLGLHRWRPLVIAVGLLVAAAGAVFAALGFFNPEALAHAIAFLQFDPGVVISTLLNGSPVGIAGLLATFALLLVSIEFLGKDALPELYAASQQQTERLARVRSVRARAHYSARVSTPVNRIPAGSLTLVWKDWLGFRRGRSVTGLWLLAGAVSAACGAVGSYFTRTADTAGVVYSLAATAALIVLVLTPFGASTALSADVAKPLFWLSNASLRSRIGALTLALTWRKALAFGLAPLAAGIASGNATLAVAALPLSFALFWSLQSLGVGLFALFPNPVDSAGPMFVLRTLCVAAYLLPPAFVALIAAALSVPAAAAATAAAATFVVQGWIVLEVASLRIAERGAAITQLSRAN